MAHGSKLLTEMTDRSREVFRRVVEGYLETGEPVGSRTLTRTMHEHVSAATIRNVMQDLEFMGLLDSPHVSAGRVPTQQGLRLFVDGFLETGALAVADRERIDATLGSNDQDVAALLAADVIAAIKSQPRGGNPKPEVITFLCRMYPTPMIHQALSIAKADYQGKVTKSLTHVFVYELRRLVRDAKGLTWHGDIAKPRQEAGQAA